MSGHDEARYTPTPVGKTQTEYVKWHQQIGTPPRLWGKPRDPTRPAPKIRYTPTPVGKTVMFGLPIIGYSRYTPTPVGKTVTASFFPNAKIGTPPRLWGKLGSQTCSSLHRRYTPTPVGKTAKAGR